MTIRVGVIGVGSIGLCAIKWARERGFDVLGFERNAEVGGVWNQNSLHSGAYDSLFTNSSKPLMSLSDFPFPFETSSIFPTHREILNYYCAYRDHYGLQQYIRFSHDVRLVEKRNGIWYVTVESPENGVEVHEFQAVTICTGKLWDESLPSWVPQVPSSIPVYHSKHYRNPDKFRNKTVLIVGVGNSALDISLELSLEEDINVLVSARRGASILPTRDSSGSPTDLKLENRMYHYKLPQTLRHWYLGSLLKPVNDRFKELGGPVPPQMMDTSFPISTLKQSEEYLRQMKTGKIKFVAGFNGKFNPDGTLNLSDGSTIKVDAIICCTGYTLHLDKFLSPALAQEICRTNRWEDGRSISYLRLYKNIMAPHDPTLFFLGFITSFGNEVAIGEMQSRWATAMLKGELPKPSIEQIEQDIQKVEAFYKRTKPTVSGFVRYVKYMDDLANDLGCRPEISSNFSPLNPFSWRIGYNLLFKAVVPAQYRLQGPDAKPEQAKAFISKL